MPLLVASQEDLAILKAAILAQRDGSDPDSGKQLGSKRARMG
jgi:hypothetical protein